MEILLSELLSRAGIAWTKSIGNAITISGETMYSYVYVALLYRLGGEQKYTSWLRSWSDALPKAVIRAPASLFET
jgi:hypothetical protein